MTTPSKTEILELAQELYRKDNPHIENNAVESELLEGGYFFSAQHQLMSTPYRQFEPDKLQKDFSKFDFNLDVPLLEKSNLLISGSNNSGKTTLSAKICSILKTLNWQIMVFDNVGNWRSKSDVDYYIEVWNNLQVCLDVANVENIIFDTSRLLPIVQTECVDLILNEVWNRRTINELKNLLIILEESELYCRNIRGLASQNILRIMHSGRNRKVRVCCLTTDLALLDPSFIRLCQQRYHGKIGIEENSRRKFKSYYGKDILEEIENLNLGEFLYLHDRELKVIKSKMFEPKQTPQNYIRPKPKRQGLIAKLLGRC